MRSLLGLMAASVLFVGGTASATTLSYTGGLTFQLSTLPGLVATTGTPNPTAVVNGSATGTHLTSLAIAAAVFGPVTDSLPVTSSGTINSVIFTGLGNQAGNFTLTAGGLAGGGAVGLSGTAKICLAFSACNAAAVPVPLTPTGTPAKGFGVGGQQTITGGVTITMQHNAWTIGQPSLSIHSANSTLSFPTLPGGFAHGPATGGASSAAQVGGVLQLVTVTKTYTSLTGAFPELPLIGVIQITFVPEPGTLLLLVSGMASLAVLARKRVRK